MSLDSEFNRYQERQVRDEMYAEIRDEIWNNLNDQIIRTVTNHLLYDRINELENLAEKYCCILIDAITIMHKNIKDDDDEQLIYDVVFRRDKSLEKVQKYAKLLVEFFYIEREVDRGIREWKLKLSEIA